MGILQAKYLTTAARYRLSPTKTALYPDSRQSDAHHRAIEPSVQQLQLNLSLEVKTYTSLTDLVRYQKRNVVIVIQKLRRRHYCCPTIVQLMNADKHFRLALICLVPSNWFSLRVQASPV